MQNRCKKWVARPFAFCAKAGDVPQFLLVILRKRSRSPRERLPTKDLCIWDNALREQGAVEIESEWTARDRERQAYGGAERIFLIPG